MTDVVIDLRDARKLETYRNPNGSGLTLRAPAPHHGPTVRVILSDEQLQQIAEKIGERVAPHLTLVTAAKILVGSDTDTPPADLAPIVRTGEGCLGT